jgi:Flp pilus assembly protein TadD
MGAGQDALSRRPGPVARLLARAWLSLFANANVILGRKHAALHAYRRILAIAPNSETALATAGNLQAETDDTEGAIATFRWLLAKNPKNAEAWFNLGFLLEQRGELGEAEVSFRRAVAIKPWLDRAWYGLGLTLIRDDRLKEAVDALKQTTKLQPFSPYGWYQLGMTYHHLGEAARAQRIYEELRKFEPRYAATLLRDIQRTTPLRAAPETGSSEVTE